MWGSLPPQYASYYVMRQNINKRTFSPLIVGGSLFDLILPVLHLLHHVAFYVALVAYEMCLLACGLYRM